MNHPKFYKRCAQCEQSKPRSLHFSRTKLGDSYCATCRECTAENKTRRMPERGDLLLDAHWRGCAGWGEVVAVGQKWRMAA